MNLLEILGKVKKGEELTPEEQKVHEDYKKSLEVMNSELERVKKEKEALEQKATSADTSLQENLKLLSEKEELAKKALEEKTKLEEETEKMKKILENTESSKKALEEINKIKIESAKKEASKKAKEEKDEALRKIQEENENIKKQLEKVQEERKLEAFRNTLLAEKAKRPYLADRLTVIEKGLDEKGLELSKTLFDYELSIVDHDKEMLNWEAKNKKGEDVFKKEKDIEVKNKGTKETEEEHLKKLTKVAEAMGIRKYK